MASDSPSRMVVIFYVVIGYGWSSWLLTFKLTGVFYLLFRQVLQYSNNYFPLRILGKLYLDIPCTPDLIFLEFVGMLAIYSAEVLSMLVIEQISETLV